MAIQHSVLALVAAGVACGSAMAQAPEMGRVLSATPVVQQVATPQEFCEDTVTRMPPRSSGTGAVLGAVVGGVAGHALGRGAHVGPRGHYYGSTRGPSTVVGAVAGGMLGHAIDTAHSHPPYQPVRRCTHETLYEDRTIGYDVTYEYAGRRYTSRLDHHPGAWVPVQVHAQGAYQSRPVTGAFVGPSGVYRSAPPGVVVTHSYEYSAPSVPIVVSVDPFAQRRPQGHPHHWR